jgi:hypothetical protein
MVKVDRGSIVGLNDALDIGNERAISPPKRVIGSMKGACYSPLAPPFSQEEMLALASQWTSQLDRPAARVFHPHSIERFHLNICQFHSSTCSAVSWLPNGLELSRPDALG